MCARRILSGFYQIASRIEDVYELYLPSEVRALLQQLRARDERIAELETEAARQCAERGHWWG